jgi:hypothetical protein
LGEAFTSSGDVDDPVEVLVDDPFEGLSLTDSSYGHLPMRKVKAGKEVTLLVVRGARDKLEGQPWDAKLAGRAEVEMHLKTRIDAVPDGELREGPQTNLMVDLEGLGKKGQ